MTANKLAILYDGECPFCRNYCALVRLKEVVDEVELIDARIPSALLAEVTALGLDIDQGMVVKWQNRIYYGSEAIHVLALLSGRTDLFNRISYRLFSSETSAGVLYPFFRSCRNGVLWLLNISAINNLKK